MRQRELEDKIERIENLVNSIKDYGLTMYISTGKPSLRYPGDFEVESFNAIDVISAIIKYLNLKVEKVPAKGERVIVKKED